MKKLGFRVIKYSMQRNLKPLSLIITTVAYFILVNTIFACQSSYILQPEEIIKQADTIVLGEVIGFEKHKVKTSDPKKEFNLIKAFKKFYQNDNDD